MLTSPLNDEPVPAEPSQTHTQQEARIALRQSFLAKRPGALNTQGTLTLKTRIAQQHFLALLTFSKKIRTIYRAALRVDPYADLYLLVVERALHSASTLIQEKMQHYHEPFASMRGLQVTLADTQHPLSLPISFTTPYAYLAAKLLLEFDELARCVISLHYLGLPLEEALTSLLHKLGQPFRSALDQSKVWRSTGVTRQDIAEQTSLALQARQLMGKLDARVLNKSLRAKLAPYIPSSSQLKNKLTHAAKEKNAEDFLTSNS